MLVQNLSGLLNSDVMMGDSPRRPYKNVAEGSGTLYGGHDVIIDDEDLVAYGSGSGSGSGDGAGDDDREPTPKPGGECRWCWCLNCDVCSPVGSSRKWQSLRSTGSGCVWAAQEMAEFGQHRKFG